MSNLACSVRGLSGAQLPGPAARQLHLRTAAGLGRVPAAGLLPRQLLRGDMQAPPGRGLST